MVKYLTVEKRGRFTEAQESKKAGAGVGKKMEFNPFRTPRVVLVSIWSDVYIPRWTQ